MIDFQLSACLNINMPKTRRKNNLNQNINSYLNTQLKWRSNRGDVHFLMKRLKENEQKKIKEKYIFAITAVGFLVVSGIIVSF